MRPTRGAPAVCHNGAEREVLPESAVRPFPRFQLVHTHDPRGTIPDSSPLTTTRCGRNSFNWRRMR